MKEDILKGKWSELSGEAKKKWGKLTDDDLMVISGNKEKMVGVLQKKYGYSKEKAEEESKSFFEKHK